MVHWFLFFFLGFSSLYASPFESNYESSSEPWGVDSDLTLKQEERQGESRNMRKKICVSMIRFYQNKISPIDGPRSHYLPSSSQYTLLAIEKYGVLKGIALGCDRLLRENSADWIYLIKDEKKLDPVR